MLSATVNADINFNWSPVTQDVNDQPIADNELQYLITHSNGNKFTQIIASGSSTSATAIGVDADPGDIYCIRAQKLVSQRVASASCVEVPDADPKPVTGMEINP